MQQTQCSPDLVALTRQQGQQRQWDRLQLQNQSHLAVDIAASSDNKTSPAGALNTPATDPTTICAPVREALATTSPSTGLPVQATALSDDYAEIESYKLQDCFDMYE